MSPDLGVAERAFVAAGHGDRRAFGDFYDQAAPLVWALCMRLVGDATQAEDAARDVLVDLWRLAPTFDPARHSVRSWCERAVGRRVLSGATPGRPALLAMTMVLGLDFRTAADELGLDPMAAAMTLTTALRRMSSSAGQPLLGSLE